MGLQALNDDDKRVVAECLQAAVTGPFFADSEFHTLFGLDRDDVARIVERLPEIDDSDETVSIAINNAMGNLLGYPHGEAAAWSDFISVSESEVQRVFHRWRDDLPSRIGGNR